MSLFNLVIVGLDMETQHYTRLIAGALAALLCTGCSTFQASGDTLSENLGMNGPAQEAEVANVKYKTPPEFTHLEAYVLSWADETAYIRAWDGIWNYCLRQTGSKLRINETALDRQAGVRGTFYGQPTRALMASGGYPTQNPWPPVGQDPLILADGTAVDDDEMMRIWRDLGGADPDGCFSRRQAALTAITESTQGVDLVQTGSDAARGKIRETHEIAAADAAVSAAAGRWRACMTAAGFRELRPQVFAAQAPAHLPGVKPAATANPAPSTTASDPKRAETDIGCRASSGYFDAYVAVVDREHSRFLLEKSDLLANSSPEARQKRREALEQLLASWS